MKFLLKSAVAAGLVLSVAPVAVAPAAAQAIKGIGIVNIPAIIGNSNAYKTAEQQRPVTYKAQIDQAENRRKQIQAQLEPLVNKFEADRRAPKPNEAALQQQAAQIQQIEQAGQRELQQILAPVSLSRAYVEEQISDKLNEAVESAAKKAKISLVMTPDSVLFADPAYNLNQGVLNELNTLLPSVQIVPPQGWLPRQLREQQEAAQAQPQPQPGQPAQPSQPAGPQPQGR
ncbi:MAG: OmpH family outer membrane protein [Novosphingobium sp.]|uniref:OmpH family outer membrane protein n=1 Tax=Tsuneonella sp. CC-YZS046 TaxID=3042152 RepID=UPI002D7982A8|nr:OmpH family outer membrane protein [Tsuneonella sp. CC-YZS046]WRO67452.1 OmpH family outer membrane protein [Tsuneonella sp. CC-YZS046]